MKQTTVLIVAIVCTIIAVQTSDAQPVRYGFKAGLNFSNFGGEDAGEWDTRTGFSLGGFLVYPLANTISVQPELLYTTKGAKDTDTFNGTSYTQTYKYSYLEVPVLGRLDIPMKNTNFRPMLFAGPAVAFRINSTWQLEEEGETYEEDDDEIKNIDIGFVVGAGVGFPVGSNTVGVEIRYDFGLTSFDDSEEKFNVKNNVLMLMVSFQL